jgi:Zn-dependent metalloprotease
MKLKKILLLFYFFVISSSLLFAQSTNNINKLKGWEKKQHISKDFKRIIAKDELRTIGNKVNQLIGKTNLNKRAKKETSFLKTLLNKKKPYLVNIKKSKYSNLKIHWSEKRKTPTYISNFNKKLQLAKTKNISATEQAISFIEENKELFQLENPKTELTVKETLKDKLGSTHVKLVQQYKGIPFWGSEIVVHSDLNGNIYSINAQYSETPTELKLQSIINDKQALTIAKNKLQLKTSIATLDSKTKKLLNYNGAKVTKYIWTDDANQKHLIWHVQIRPNIRDNWYFFVDALTGKILQSYNATNFDGPLTATASDLNGVSRNINVYNSGGTDYMIDASRDMWQTGQTNIIDDPKGAVLTIDAHGKDLTNETKLFHVTTTTANWNDPVSVSAHYNAGFVYEYYKTTHGRNAIDNKGSTVLSVIHVTDKGEAMDNAYWNGAFMIYGDGNQAFKPLAGALDVSGHEMTHGVIQHTVALEYKFQSGALNESLADVFGSMVDKEDWLLGEDVTKTSYIATGALRNMLDPHNGGSSLNDNGWQPAHMNEFLNLTINQDNGGVHINSGIPNRACALIGNAIGKEKTEKIYYRTLSARYLNSQSQFIDMRLAAVRAATDLYGDNSTEVNAVKQAFDNVGILDGSGTKPPEDIPPVEGDEWIAAINAETNDNSLYLIRPVINTNDDLKQITTTQVFTNTGNPISVTDDGSVILFIDNHNAIRAIRSNGTDETVISTDSVWKSIALSPDGTKLAATTYWEDALIYIFDLENSNNSKAVKLYNPTTQEGVKDSVVKYADALDWDLSSQFIVYDSFNKVPKASGSNIEFWVVNILDVQNEKIYSIFPPQEEGISFGNPSFGQTNDNYLIFDKIDFNNSIDEIWAVNLFSGEGNIIENNGSSIGFPRYSPNDEHIVFQKIDDQGKSNLRQINLADNKISSNGESVNYVTGGQLPTWFAIGTRPVSVKEKQNKIITDYHLYQNYPNPFNPTTIIKYSIPIVEANFASTTNVTLKIFDVLGKEIVTLVNEMRMPGTYKVNFDASKLSSGIYYYQLRVGNIVQTKKMLLVK